MPDIAIEAARMATLAAVDADLLIAALTHEAIGRWKLDEATFWQRVRFRSRMLRARRGDIAGRKEGRAC